MVADVRVYIGNIDSANYYEIPRQKVYFVFPFLERGRWEVGYISVSPHADGLRH